MKITVCDKSTITQLMRTNNKLNDCSLHVVSQCKIPITFSVYTS